MPFDKAVGYIPGQFRSRFHYWECDVEHVRYDDLAATLVQCGGSMHQVNTVHMSPSCKTVSIAHHGRNPHRDGDWRSDDAIKDDRVLTHVCELLQTIGKKHPTILQSLENPLCMFAEMPPVQQLAD